MAKRKKRQPDPPRRGRPPLPERRELYRIRLRPSEHEAYQREAGGGPVTVWMRDVLNEVAGYEDPHDV